MKKHIVCALLLAFLLVSCGGGDDNPGPAASVALFAGQWQGSWSNAENSFGVDMTVSGDGQVTGYLADATFHDPLSGSIDNYGNFHFTVTITYQNTAASGSGFLTIYTPTGHMVGTIYFLGNYYQPDMVRASP